MGNETLKKLQSMSHKVNSDKTPVAQEFLGGLKRALANRGYRADLSISTSARNTFGTFTASVPFDAQLGHPSEDDLVTLVASTYPTHEIDWELAQVDSDAGVVMLSLRPSQDIIPVASVKEIPPEFVAIGTGLYKRAVDSSVNEIWTLRKTDDGLVLARNSEDIEVNATDEEQLKAGDVANTPYGPGRIVRFDDFGNALVQVGSKKHLVAAADLGAFSTKKEQKKLEDYYSMMYGDPSFAAELTRTQEEIVKDVFSTKK